MRILGLSIIDIAIIVIYLFGMMWIGKRLAGSVKNQSDFFLAGRKLGKVVQFFLNFGNMTDANGAASITSVAASRILSIFKISVSEMILTAVCGSKNAIPGVKNKISLLSICGGVKPIPRRWRR